MSTTEDAAYNFQLQVTFNLHEHMESCLPNEGSSFSSPNESVGFLFLLQK